MIEVELSLEDVKQCVVWGFEREMMSLAKGRKHHFAPRSLWEHQMVGFMGELALHRWLKIETDYKPGAFFARKYGDVSGYEIRARRNPNSDLSVSPGYPESRKWILAIVKSHTKVHLVGWIGGSQAQKIGKVKPNDPGRPVSYLVPQSELRPMEHLLAATLADTLGTVTR